MAGPPLSLLIVLGIFGLLATIPQFMGEVEGASANLKVTQAIYVWEVLGRSMIIQAARKSPVSRSKEPCPDFTIQHKEESANKWISTDAVTRNDGSGYLLQGLTPDTVYDIRVSCKDSITQKPKDWSNTIRLKTFEVNFGIRVMGWGPGLILTLIVGLLMRKVIGGDWSWH